MSHRLPRTLLSLLFLGAFLPACGGDASAGSKEPPETPTAGQTAGFYALRTETLEGEPASLGSYAGKVALVVNVASKCGFTPQYAGLEQLYEEYRDRGLVVLGFPSNDFRNQEPGSPEEIREFCTQNYGVEFPLFKKCQVKEGEDQSPVYRFLAQAAGEAPSWNFCKYLVSRDGHVLNYFPSNVAPQDEAMITAIEGAL